MKKYIIYSVAIILALLTFGTACSKFEDMSKNPYALYDSPSESFVHPIMFKSQYNLLSVFRSMTAPLMQYGVSVNSEVSSRVVDNYNIPEATTDDIWSAFYLQWGNAVVMHNTAIQENNKPMQGVALIIKAFLMTHITDTYGEVPFKEAGQLAGSAELGVYTTAYDTQKDIYREIICMLEDANEFLAVTEVSHFSAVCDKIYGGVYDKWRRFGNSLYARVLTRIAMKVIEEDRGVLELNEKWEAVSITQKLGELYSSFQSGAGDYPQMRSRDDRPLVPFSTLNETEHTPFYTTTSGNWNVLAVCDQLCIRMLDYNKKVDSDGITYYEYKASSAGGHPEDPRYDSWWKKVNGMPTHLLSDARTRFLDSSEHKSQAGNSKIGRMVRGYNPTTGLEEPSALWGHVYDLQNASTYPLMQYSELLFIYAEAGARDWVKSLSGIGAYSTLYKNAITESILEWNPYVTAEDPLVVDYVEHCLTGEKFSGSPFNSDNAIEAILTQKWIAQFFIGIESWCDYRRTGYPLLKTNGPAAGNDQILPTRMRYPSDELYRNPEAYPAALDRWLGGTNNNKTDVWWADTQESYQIRLKGRL